MKLAQKTSLLISTFLLLLFAVTGCGGSSSNSGNGGGTAGKVALYATDSLGNNDHVWVTIYQITVTGGTASQTMFDDSSGKVVDLASLRDGAGGKFDFLALAPCSGGPFNAAVVTMDKDLTLVPSGSTGGMAKQFADQFDVAGGKTQIRFDFQRPRALGQTEPELVVDFDLQNWNEVGGKIVPAIKDIDGSGVDDRNRHNDDDHGGSISGLTGTAPDQQFTLSTGSSRSVIVRTDVNTVIFRANNQPNPVLANGQHVEVRGTYLVADGFLKAKSIKIEDANGLNRPDARGPVRAIDAAAGTFDVMVKGCEGFLPQGSIVHVASGVDTVFRSHRGVTLTKDEFFVALVAAGTVEVEGAYDGTSNTITAKRAKIEDAGGGDGGVEAEAKGATLNVDSVSGTFSLTLSVWEGFAGSAGQVVSVTTAGPTVFLDKSGNIVSKADFFSLVQQFGHAEVKGTFANGAIAAKKCKVEND